MADPIVFISHFRVLDGKADALREMFARVIRQLEAGKPRTTAQLGYLDETRGRMTIVHVFRDAQVMAEHFRGSAERSASAYELFTPDGWEIYGRPSQAILDQMRDEAAAAGVSLVVDPEYVGGFLRAREGALPERDA